MRPHERLEQVELLARKIAEMATEDDVAPDVVFSALQLALTFWLSTVCVDCRNDIACKLRADIPSMVDTATRLAALPHSNSVRH
jgi:hypothetical protein